MRASLPWLAPAGAVVCGLALVAAALMPPDAWRAWLGAAFLWASTSIGALTLLMIMRLAPGDWSAELGPFMQAQTLLLPLGALLMIPVLAETARLYPWTHETLRTPFRIAWLSTPFFIARSIVWYAVLLALAWRLVMRDGAVATASIGLVLLPVMGIAIADDWLLSLDPDFASSGFALYVLAIQTLTAFALMLAALVVSGRTIARPGILAALLLTQLLFWDYLAFVHYLITWSDNLPSGVAWYQRRRGPWTIVMWLVGASRVVPTFLLFFQAIRHSPRALLRLSVAVIAGSVLEAAWLALPAADPPATWSDSVLFAVANLGMGALTVGAFQRMFAWRMARAAA